MRKLPGLTAMKVFEVVGQTRSFTRAAERLNITQSAVSRQVRHLEEQLDKPLFIRRHHDLELTESGSELLATIQEAFHSIELSVRSITEKSNHNRLRVNVPPTFAKRWLLPRLGRLREAMPDVELSLTTALTDSLSERGLLDCAVRFGDGEWPILDASILMTEKHIAVCSPALFAQLMRDGAVDLSSATFLHVLAGADTRYLTWRHWLDAAGFRDIDTRGGMEFDLLDLAIAAACAGQGITVADKSMVASELRSGALVQLFDVEVEGHESYWFVTRPQSAERQKVTAFRRWLVEEAAKR